MTFSARSQTGQQVSDTFEFFESQALRVHAPQLAARSARSYHVVSSQTSAASSHGIDIKIISTTHASTLQTLQHLPAPADKSRTVHTKPPLTRPSLQPAPTAAVAPQGDFSRNTGDAVRRYSRQ
jgi:hypothetical protein